MYSVSLLVTEAVIVTAAAVIVTAAAVIVTAAVVVVNFVSLCSHVLYFYYCQFKIIMKLVDKKCLNAVLCQINKINTS